MSVDLAAGSAEGFDSISGVENVTGGDGFDSIAGDDEANMLNGGSGGDDLVGRGDNDTLSGGTGNDTLTGGTGVDTIYGEDDDDDLVVDGSDVVAGETYDGGDDTDTLRVTGTADFTDSTVLSTEQLRFDGGVVVANALFGSAVVIGSGVTFTSD